MKIVQIVEKFRGQTNTDALVAAARGLKVRKSQLSKFEPAACGSGVGGTTWGTGPAGD